MKKVVKGSIVRFENGWYRVTRLTSKTVNLGGVFGNTVYHKGIPLELVYEDEDNWYKRWSQSESYMCM